MVRRLAEEALVARSIAWGAFLTARAAGDVSRARELHTEYVRANEAAMRAVREYRDASAAEGVAA